jgi:hypothetical protein
MPSILNVKVFISSPFSQDPCDSSKHEQREPGQDGE